MFKTYYMSQKKEKCFAGEFASINDALNEALNTIYDERMCRWAWVELEDGTIYRKYYGCII